MVIGIDAAVSVNVLKATDPTARNEAHSQRGSI